MTYFVKKVFLFKRAAILLAVLSLLPWGCSKYGESENTNVKLKVNRQDSGLADQKSARAIDLETYPEVAVEISVTAPDLDEVLHYGFSAQEVSESDGILEMEVPSGVARTFDVDLLEILPGSTNEFPGKAYIASTPLEDRTVDLVGETITLTVEMESSPTVTQSGVIKDSRMGTFEPLAPCAKPNVTMTYHYDEIFSGKITITVAPDGSYVVTNVPVDTTFTIEVIDWTTGANISEPVYIPQGDVTKDFELEGASGVSIDPSSVAVESGVPFVFSASGGIPPYLFDFQSNNSAGSITSDGTYTPGPIMDVTDTVIVTDQCYTGPADDYSFSLAGAYVSLITQCNDGIDNDGDTFTDYPDDPGCDEEADSSELGTNECDDGIDNDGDTLADYPDDPGCTDPTDSDEHGTVECDDGIDDDNWGDTDQADPGCSTRLDPDEYEAGVICDDGIHNDFDGLMDEADPVCTVRTGMSEIDSLVHCDDGIDNDGDTSTDWPADVKCSAPTDINERNVWFVDDSATGLGLGNSWTAASPNNRGGGINCHTKKQFYGIQLRVPGQFRWLWRCYNGMSKRFGAGYGLHIRHQ